MTIPYLVSTAGHAQYQNEQYPHHIQSLTQLIREGAEDLGSRPVVGFARPEVDTQGKDKKDENDRIIWQCDRYSFRNLLDLSAAYAVELKKLGLVECATGEQQIISLLAPTGVDFLIVWIACMGLGYGMVFIAPQCSPTAVAHLTTVTKSTALLYHPQYSNLCKGAAESLGDIPTLRLGPVVIGDSVARADADWPRDPQSPHKAVSHVFHTSGTSGTPKPIPQTHASSVVTLPRRQHGEPDTLESSFTTTPLFHGGVSDLLRAWMARSILYLYPSSTTAVTAANIMGAYRACSRYPPDSTFAPPITAFLSVPYILTLLSPTADPTDAEGATAMLANMDIVSTGGAPLDTAVGNGLVQRGVHLTSRLGSSECGFLLTSYRDFKTDKEWEWLRNDSPYSSALKFEQSGTDPTGKKAEMIVTSAWKSKVKSNRDNGDYATGDLYERHPTKDNVWKYAGRGDDVVVLSNGEKFSPGPIESVFRSHGQIADALVVGVNQTQIGCLIFPRNIEQAGELEAELDGLIATANKEAPSHAQLGKEMCLVIQSQERINALPKSSKGTIQRGLAYDVFKSETDRLYVPNPSEGREHKLQLEGQDLIEWLVERVREVAGNGRHQDSQESLQEDTDLFSWGVDSVKAARLRFIIAQKLDIGNANLPLNVVFENSTVAGLAALCTALRTGQQHKKHTAEDDVKLMHELVHKYGDFSQSSTNGGPRQSPETITRNGGKTVILTGATGSLGSHLLHVLASFAPDVVKKVVCLVRGADDAVATDRVKRALGHRRLELDPVRFQVIAARLGKTNLGLNEEVYYDLAQDTDIVIHAAWAVHFGSRLESFEKDHIQGTRNLLDLVAQSASSNSRFLFCSSIASVLNGLGEGDTVYEKLSGDPATAVSIGYSQSKWVTEQICAQANESIALKDRVQVLRIGQLCGDTRQGIWNESEGWPLMIKTAQTTGKLPMLRENPSWLPVDVAAQSVVEIALKQKTCHQGRPPVFHVANPQLTDWSDILQGLKDAGLDFSPAPPHEWVEQVKNSPGDAEADPTKGMLSMWQAAYGEVGRDAPAALVKSEHATTVSPTLATCEPISGVLIRMMVEAWKASGFLQG